LAAGDRSLLLETADPLVERSAVAGREQNRSVVGGGNGGRPDWNGGRRDLRDFLLFSMEINHAGRAVPLFPVRARYGFAFVGSDAEAKQHLVCRDVVYCRRYVSVDDQLVGNIAHSEESHD
jgi:hypothetical protein